MNWNATRGTQTRQEQFTNREQTAYYAHHDFEGPAKLSTTLIHAISDVANIDTRNIESTLFQHVDPDALDALFSPVDQDIQRTNGHVSLVLWGYNVTIYSNGQIVISEPRQPAR